MPRWVPDAVAIIVAEPRLRKGKLAARKLETFFWISTRAFQKTLNRKIGLVTMENDSSKAWGYRVDIFTTHPVSGPPPTYPIKSTVIWAANKRFNILKFKFKFAIARTFELFRARSRLAGWLVDRTIFKN